MYAASNLQILRSTSSLAQTSHTIPVPITWRLELPMENAGSSEGFASQYVASSADPDQTTQS